MKERARSLPTLLLALTLTFAMMTGLAPALGGSSVHAATVVKENRWNFQSNEVGRNDMVHAGEFKQVMYDENLAGDNFPQLDGYLGKNSWIMDSYRECVTGENDHVSDGNTYPGFALISLHLLATPTYTFDKGMDTDLLNRTLNEVYGPYLFTEREYAVMSEGFEEDILMTERMTLSKEAPSSDATPALSWINDDGELVAMYSVPDEGEFETIGGNKGYKLWAPSWIELFAPQSLYKSDGEHNLIRAYSKYIYDIPVRSFRNYRSNSGMWFYNDEIVCPPFDVRTGAVAENRKDILGNPRTASYIRGEQSKKIAGKSSVNAKMEYYPVSFDLMVACVGIENQKVVIRREAGREFSGPIGPDAIQAVEKTEAHEWKLTVIEDDRNFQIANVEAKDGLFSLTYTGAKLREQTGDEEDISVIIENKNGDLWYGRIAETNADGTAAFRLPSGYSDDCKIWVFNETNRGDEKTDFCSNVVQLTLPAHIILDANDGDCEVGDTYAESYSRAGALPAAERAGYEFTGWYDNAGGEGEALKEDDRLAPGTEITLYAGWKPVDAESGTPAAGAEPGTPAAGTGPGTPAAGTEPQTPPVTAEPVVPPAGAADTSELEEAIEKAEKIDEEEYTEASIAILETVLDSARDALGSNDQNAVDKAVKALNAALDALREKNAIPFTDVAKEDYFYDAVVWAFNAEPQITDGTSDTTFSPAKTCARGQVVTFLWRSQGCPEPSSSANPFVDVSESDYFYKPVLWAVEQGITDGTDAAHFSPKTTCRNSHILTFIYRAVGEPNKTGEGSWYSDAYNWANFTGLLKGSYSGSYDINADCPRANVVYYLHQMDK